jgi:peptide/nickel transport system permease protein
MKLRLHLGKEKKINLTFAIGAALALFIVLLTLSSFFYTPYDYNEVDGARRFLPPSLKHFFGTDNFGRDIFSRVMTGARYTLLTALFTVAGSAAAGSALGMACGFAGDLRDEIVMRIMDAASSIPGILLALVVVALAGNSQGTLIIALLIIFIPSFTRVMRNGMLTLKGRDFVLAARIAEVPPARIIFVHIFPNLAPQLLAACVIGLSNAILAESTMSFLGLGIQPPVPSWGRMLSESQSFLFNAPHCALIPGSMIMITVLAFHFLGEGISSLFPSADSRRKE